MSIQDDIKSLFSAIEKNVTVTIETKSASDNEKAPTSAAEPATFDSLEDMLDKLDNTLDSLEDDIDKILQRFDMCQSTLSEIKGSLDKLENTHSADDDEGEEWRTGAPTSPWIFNCPGRSNRVYAKSVTHSFLCFGICGC